MIYVSKSIFSNKNIEALIKIYHILLSMIKKQGQLIKQALLTKDNYIRDCLLIFWI